MNSFTLDLIQNWIIGVVENLEEAVEAQNSWVSAVVFVYERAWELGSPNVLVSSKVLKEAVSILRIPVFARVRFGHKPEAELVESFWVDWILEAENTPDSLENPLKQEDFWIPVISEISSLKFIRKWQSNYLILWEFATWNVVDLVEKLKDWKEKKDLKVFVWGGIATPADLWLLYAVWGVRWVFVWTAIFDQDLDVRGFINECVNYIKV